MAAAQNMVKTSLGKDKITKGKKKGILLTKPHDLCFGGVQNKVKGRESLLDTKKSLL